MVTFKIESVNSFAWNWLVFSVYYPWFFFLVWFQQTSPSSCSKCLWFYLLSQKKPKKVFELFQDEDYKQSYEYAGKIKDKIAKMRQSGLETDGIYSPENLAFKLLRNHGYLEKLSSLRIRSYDKLMSVKNSEITIDENKVWRNYLNQGNK